MVIVDDTTSDQYFKDRYIFYRNKYTYLMRSSRTRRTVVCRRDKSLRNGNSPLYLDDGFAIARFELTSIVLPPPPLQVRNAIYSAIQSLPPPRWCLLQTCFQFHLREIAGLATVWPPILQLNTFWFQQRRTKGHFCLISPHCVARIYATFGQPRCPHKFKKQLLNIPLQLSIDLFEKLFWKFIDLFKREYSIIFNGNCSLST